MGKLSETLRERGFIYQFSSPTLEEITDGPKRTVYLGVDPTAESIHVGNLAAFMLLRHFADHKHRVILLLGGGTGMIGDPKPDVERPLLSPEVISHRVEKLRFQASTILGGIDVDVVDNGEWLGSLGLIDFLRDTGKFFTVNGLVKKDAIAARMQGEEGISFTEFSYPLLQAYDFWHLFRERGCDVQIGGSDQWGNIVAGVDLIRRKDNGNAFALTIPIIVDKASGKKFGKSEGNAVWLDPEMTSPFAFYQFWFNTSDESCEDYLKLFTVLPLRDIADAMKMHRAQAGERAGQRLLAHSVTQLVHGEAAAGSAQRISEVLFGDTSLGDLTADDVRMLTKEAPSCNVQEGESIVDVLVRAGLSTSKREARQLLSDRAIQLNSETIDGPERTAAADDFENGLALLKKGRRSVCVLTL